jgi:NTE family protein
MNIVRMAAPLAAALVVLCAVPQSAAAQSQAAAAQAAPRPKVGLVLGGGGARGLAHIGVLKVMHELRVPVDYVTGTSMGSIVGGTFASGVSVADMERKVLALDWDAVLDDRVARENVTQRRKDDERTPLIRLELGVRDGALQLPAGAIYGQKLAFLLADLTAGTPGRQDFDQLPTPFRAVATDLETGEMVVFDKGYLRQTMRASMSVPGAFDPVELDGRIMVDGGLVRNVPVDIARKMGADVVIAIDVGALNRTRDQLTSLPAVLDQMVNISIRRNADESLASLTGRDVKIVPDLGDIGSASFNRAADAIAVGEKAARAAAAQLTRYSVSPAEYEAWLQHRSRGPATTALVPAFIDTEGLARVNPEVVLGMMNTKPGEPLDVERLTDDIDRLNSRGDFNGIDAIAVTDERGTGLRMKFIEKSWGPNFMRFGLNLSSDFQGNAYYNLLARYTRTWINDLGGELRGDVSIGRTRRLSGELYQPLNYSGTLFVRPYAGTERTTQDFFIGGDRAAQYDIGADYVGVDLGSQFFKWGEASIGVRYADSSAKPLIALPGLFPTFDVPAGGVTFRAVYDQLDNFFFPTSGSLVEVKGLLAREWAGSPQDSERVTLNAMKAFHFGPHNFSLALEAGRLYGGDERTFSNLFLGGLFRLSGLQTDQLYGNELVLGRLLYSYRIARLPSLLGGNIVTGFTVEAGNNWRRGENASLSDLIYAGSVYFGADTFAGPFYLAYGQAEGGRGAFYMYLGRPF